MIDVDVHLDMTGPQQALDSLRETCRFLSTELVRVAPGDAAAAAKSLSDFSKQLRPENRVIIEEFVTLLSQETPS
ncbi:MAG: hypothetical protein KDJ90_12795 [Nitratireductor sp.]|nr:hypothetical protein [Nitratireductor sp.]